MHAVLQALAFFEWYSVKCRQDGLKLDLLKVPIGQWGAFFVLIFLGQVRCCHHTGVQIVCTHVVCACACIGGRMPCFVFAVCVEL